MSNPPKFDPKWAEAKRRCRLNMDDIRMAKELGLNPRSLMKNIPNKSQQWKQPVNLWIRELHHNRFGRKKKVSPVALNPPVSPRESGTEEPLENVPF